MSHLDAGQLEAVAALQAVVNGADEQVAIAVLDSVGWDVQRAVDLLFVEQPVEQHQFDIDESDVRMPRPTLATYSRPLLAVFAIPLHILSNIFRFVLGLLRIPVPQFRFSGLSFYTPRPRRRFGGPDRWVRELEEETGAISMSSGKSTGVDAGRARFPDDTKVLPDFTLGSYDEALRTCERDARIGCIVLVSEEHDDDAEFKRSTLTNPEFVRLLYDNNVVVWGGDVRDHEAYSAAEKLQATTYPFVAFLALQPRRNPSSSSSSSSPALTVLSRHQGLGPTCAASLSAHLTTQLLPRVTPFLARIHAQHAARARDRLLRSEQDAAFRATAARDRERIESKLAAERAAAQRVAEAEAQRQQQLSREAWRRFTRRTLSSSSSSPSSSSSTAGLRIAIRLPAGGRIIHTFLPTQSLTSLYAFVDAQLVPSSLPPSEDPESSPDGDACDTVNLEASIENQLASTPDWWGFQLVSAFPRKEVPWVLGTRLGDVDVLNGGSQLVVEMTNDAYDTESDDDDDE